MKILEVFLAPDLQKKKILHWNNNWNQENKTELFLQFTAKHLQTLLPLHMEKKNHSTQTILSI